MSVLDNPVWNSLSHCHQHLLIGDKQGKRYPREYTAFVSVPEEDYVDDHVAQLVAPSESIYFINVAPKLSDRWSIEYQTSNLKQMICLVRPTPLRDTDCTDIRLLTVDDHPRMFELTSLVYPEFFRAKTAHLGSYYGVLKDGKIIAMAGERMRIPGYQEVSTVCTHPDYVGKGHASRVLSVLVDSIFKRGDIPFLHVSGENTRAIALYERLGFTIRRSMLLIKAKLRES